MDLEFTAEVFVLTRDHSEVKAECCLQPKRNTDANELDAQCWSAICKTLNRDLPKLQIPRSSAKLRQIPAKFRQVSAKFCQPHCAQFRKVSAKFLQSYTKDFGIRVLGVLGSSVIWDSGIYSQWVEGLGLGDLAFKL